MPLLPLDLDTHAAPLHVCQNLVCPLEIARASAPLPRAKQGVEFALRHDAQGRIDAPAGLRVIVPDLVATDLIAPSPLGRATAIVTWE